MAVEEYVREFEKEEQMSRGVTFIRGGIVNPDMSSTPSEGSSEVYKVQVKNPTEVDSKKSSLDEGKYKEEKKVKQIDLFMEEIKREQELSEKKKQRFNYDNQESTSCNIWVGNLSESVTKEIIIKEFEKFGPILNVKIVDHSKNESEQFVKRKKSNRYCFIHFHNHENALKAKNAMDGMELCGRVIDVSWARMPQHLAQAIYIQDIKDSKKKELIDRTSQLTAKYGYDFEILLVEQMKNNPSYHFLIPGNPDNMYYRWRVYSLLQGDTLSHWREEPFQMFINGPFWIPPKLPFKKETKESLLPESLIEKGKPLSDEHKSKMQRLMESLVTTSRSQIRKLMGFSIDHSESAPYLVEMISNHLYKDNIPIQSSLAHLYLIHDILHNSSLVSNQYIHLFRTSFEYTLPKIFKSLYHKLEDIVGIIRKQNFKDNILKVLNIWEDSLIYTKHFVDNLRKLFLFGGEQDDSVHPENSNTDTLMNIEEYDAEIDGIPIDIEDIDFDEE